MRWRDLTPFTQDAVLRTHVRWDGSDRADVPTWDGSVLHLGRLEKENHVLHEVAHFIATRPWHRALPNYGLMRDPDGGPSVDSFIRHDIQTGRIPPDGQRLMRDLARVAPDKLMAIIDHKMALEESLAAVVSVRLLAAGGLAWADEMRRVFGQATPEMFWTYVQTLAQRGVDLDDPLRPFPRDLDLE